MSYGEREKNRDGQEFEMESEKKIEKKIKNVLKIAIFIFTK
jgi:hypothetical protein